MSSDWKTRLFWLLDFLTIKNERNYKKSGKIYLFFLLILCTDMNENCLELKPKFPKIEISKHSNKENDLKNALEWIKTDNRTGHFFQRKA